MTDALLKRAPKGAVPITLLMEKEFTKWRKKQPARVQHWCDAREFTAKAGSHIVLPTVQGKVAQVVAGVSERPSLWDIADLPNLLPKGVYTLDWKGQLAFHEWLALGWRLGTYRFDRYKKKKHKVVAQLALNPDADAEKIERYASAIEFARDLINTPAEHMGPAELGGVAVEIAKAYGAKIEQVVGDDLLKKNYPAIHAVGRASVRPPRLIDIRWGDAKAPLIALVGKGVCFDTGGLDIKSSSAMYTMKKDMGGAAITLALATMIMDAKLPVRLRVLIPAVENAVAGNAYRPSDVITMRNGTTVEVGNTDAEGRLILADAIADAVTEKPEMLIDISTLTGAARTAVGTDISALFCNDMDLSARLAAAGKDMEDPVWPLPLHDAYRKMLDSPVADLNSAPGSPYAGAITAALFIEHFVGTKTSWAHFDLMAWNPSSRPGRPEGGEAMALRAIYRVIEQFARKT